MAARVPLAPPPTMATTGGFTPVDARLFSRDTSSRIAAVRVADWCQGDARGVSSELSVSGQAETPSCGSAGSPEQTFTVFSDTRHRRPYHVSRICRASVQNEAVGDEHVTEAATP